MIIGLTGNPGSGKTAIAQYLADNHGFLHFEGSDYLRTAAEERGTTLLTRNDYSELHRALQKKFGPTVLADYALSLPNERVVFAGLRSTQNAQKIQAAGGIIIALEAPREIRYARKQGSDTTLTLSDFAATEEAQLVSSDHLGADLLATMNLADSTLDTSGALTGIYQKIDDLLLKIQK